MTIRREVRTDAGFELGFGAGINQRDEYKIDVQECQSGYNFLIDPVGEIFTRRPAQDLVATAPNAGTITGIIQLIKQDSTQTQLVVAGDTIYDWNGASAFTDVTPPVYTSGASGSRLRGIRWPLDDYLILTDIDKNNPLLKWDGTTCERQRVGLTAGSSLSVSALTRVGPVATAITTVAHGWSTGELVTVESAVETDYNGQHVISVVDSITFTYPVSGSPTTPATGTITATRAANIKAKHGVVLNGRTWLFNLEIEGDALPHVCLASDFEDPTNYDNVKRAGDSSFSSGNEAFYLVSPDLKPIVNVGLFYDNLVLATDDGQLFILSGADSTDYAFDSFYVGSGGASDEGMVNVGNDLLYFRTGKVIESLISTDRYGDVAADDMSWWVPDIMVDMSNPISVYDRTHQRVYFFDSGIGGVLVLDKSFMGNAKFVDKRLSPWTFYETRMDNGFVTKAATYIRAFDEDTYTVYWGDDVGGIYNINGTGDLGDAATYTMDVARKSRVITELNANDELMVGRIEYKRSDAVTVDLVFAWLDSLNQDVITVNLKEPLSYAESIYFSGAAQYWSDADYWGAVFAVADAEQRSNQGFSASGKGSGLVLTVQASVLGDFNISRIYV